MFKAGSRVVIRDDSNIASKEEFRGMTGRIATAELYTVVDLDEENTSEERENINNRRYFVPISDLEYREADWEV